MTNEGGIPSGGNGISLKDLVIRIEAKVDQIVMKLDTKADQNVVNRIDDRLRSVEEHGSPSAARLERVLADFENKVDNRLRPLEAAAGPAAQRRGEELVTGYNQWRTDVSNALTELKASIASRTAVDSYRKWLFGVAIVAIVGVIGILINLYISISKAVGHG